MNRKTARLQSLTSSFIRALALVCLVMILGVGSAKAGWDIDPAKFHISAHGQMGCAECHEEVADELENHPVPARVKTKSAQRFDIDKCLACHDSVAEGLAEKRHGAKSGIDPADYQKCAQCHDPHYTFREGENRAEGFDPGLAPQKQCAVCHEARIELPGAAEEDAACLQCHRLKPDTGPERTGQVENLCLACHGPEGNKGQGSHARLALPLSHNRDHAELDCLTCHTAAADYDHHNQPAVDCLACHTSHDEKSAGGDAHRRVSCQACHGQGMEPVRNLETGLITAKQVKGEDGLSRTHRLAKVESEATCRKCHQPGNRHGAAGLVLPPKSIICMPCHAATLSVGDFTSIAALVIFGLGLLLSISVWFSAGSAAKPGHHNGQAGSVGPFIKGFVVDGLLQRSLWQASPARWLIHALIVWPFFIRFSLGLIGLIASLTAPEATWFWALLDKNHPLAGFIFDLTGLLVIIGVVAAVIRRAKQTGQPGGLPGQDRLALSLLGGILLAGFLLEGMRISMTGAPGGSEFAFIGHAVSGLFKGIDLTGVYGYFWYAHAILTGLFVAYLPFSRMFHIILGPVSAGLAAVTRKRHGTSG